MTIRRILRALIALACLVNLGLWFVYGTGARKRPQEAAEIVQAIAPHPPAPRQPSAPAFPAPAAPPKDDAILSGRAYVVDGDTIRIGGQSIRLTGIDAPESKQICKLGSRDWACGEAARDELRKIIGGRSVSCDISERDKYNRALAQCHAGDDDIAREMVVRGMALAYQRYTDRYAADEAAAHAARRGIWKAQFTPPEQWRHAQDQ